MTPVFTAIFAAGGVLAAIALRQIFRRMPTRWLLDYGETEISEDLKQIQLLPLVPDAIILALGNALLFSLTYLAHGIGTYTILVLLASQPLILIMTADQKTRIIPDQFVLALVPCFLAFWAYDSLTGNEPWGTGLLWRLAAGLAGGLFLFLCGWIGSKITRREAMGMGDVKLVFACGLLVGMKQMPLLLIISFISAAFLALPLLIRRFRHPDSDAEMAFGPFIALAGILVMGFSSFFTDLWLAYLDLLAR